MIFYFFHISTNMALFIFIKWHIWSLLAKQAISITAMKERTKTKTGWKTQESNWNFSKYKNQNEINHKKYKVQLFIYFSILCIQKLLLQNTHISLFILQYNLLKYYKIIFFFPNALFILHFFFVRHRRLNYFFFLIEAIPSIPSFLNPLSKSKSHSKLNHSKISHTKSTTPHTTSHFELVPYPHPTPTTNQPPTQPTVSKNQHTPIIKPYHKHLTTHN